MLTQEQLTHWFTYHPPTEEQKPKYAAIRDAESAAHEALDATDHNEVNARLAFFAQVIDHNAPDSADKSAAIRCVRIARNAINERIVLQKGTPGLSQDPALCRDIARQNLLMARWQASAAIALDGR